MGAKLSGYVQKNYSDCKSDLFAAFIEKCGQMTKLNGVQAMITQHAFMFLSSYEKLREKLILKDTLNMAHLGARAFEEIGGEVVQTTTWISRNSSTKNYKATYVRLVDFNSQQAKELAFLKGGNRHIAQKENFCKIPGMPIAYWVRERVLKNYEKSKILGEIAYPKTGMTTGNNSRFLRMWYEVETNRCSFDCENSIQSIESKLKWFPYCKGGGFRRWYGYNEYLINWEADGYEIKNNIKDNGLKAASVRSESLYFKKLITWSAVASGKFSCRLVDKGFLFDSGGSSISINDNDKYLLSLLNGVIGQYYLDISNATINYQPGDIAGIPVVMNEDKKLSINELANASVYISKKDWNLFETSWDFKIHPLLKLLDLGSNMKLSNVFNIWKTETEEAFEQLKYNEEELNRIFIEIYELQDELTPEVEDNDITIRKADRVRDIKSFISYAVGCMFGRYSLDEEGLIYAGGEWLDKFKIENGKWTIKKSVKEEDGNLIEDTWVDATFAPDDDNVIPITDDEYFEDDIVSRFVEFIKVTYGEKTLEENIDYIADTLGKKGNETSRQTIRRYFLKDFYKDHLKTYQKRPIYWLFDSGKNDGFKALIYMHRYDIGTVARVRTDYLHILQRKYEAEVNRLDMVMENSNESLREKTEARKKKEKLQKQIFECVQYDQVIAHVANQKVSIDLDDGVSVNYGKFQGIEVPQGEGKKALKADLLGKI